MQTKPYYRTAILKLQEKVDIDVELEGEEGDLVLTKDLDVILHEILFQILITKTHHWPDQGHHDEEDDHLRL